MPHLIHQSGDSRNGSLIPAIQSSQTKSSPPMSPTSSINSFLCPARPSNEERGAGVKQCATVVIAAVDDDEEEAINLAPHNPTVDAATTVVNILPLYLQQQCTSSSHLSRDCFLHNQPSPSTPPPQELTTSYSLRSSSLSPLLILQNSTQGDVDDDTHPHLHGMPVLSQPSPSGKYFVKSKFCCHVLSTFFPYPAVLSKEKF